MKKYPIIEPIIVILIGVGVIISSFFIKVVVTSISIGPDFMPRLLGIFMVILGICLVPEAVKKQKAVAAEAAPTGEKVRTPFSFKQFYEKNLHMFAWLLMLLYGLSMKPLGFLFSSIIYLFVGMVMLTGKKKKRNWWAIVLISLIVPTVIYIVFRQKFYLMLPVGLCKYIPLKILR